ncbi:OprD family outer membrane porin [Halopseudomonas nanhaiensis]|uniref:OprD family outer membrane porin n=1 Tax=Halopseudomonas nanhaiensis TaxID=2830842 RepID=UPI001CBB19E1|nr:OprD family outer membrane porin [Halopseudomonas nanhaiensis]UAW99209.1 OprD family outer membrane porin [Halopseudomonas nanhaiensis]
MKLRGNRLAAAIAASVWSAASVALETPPGLDSAELELRNYYINQDQRSGDPDYSRVEEWGQSFILNLDSAYTPGTVGFGMDLLGQYAVRLDSGGRIGKDDLTRQPGDLFPLDDGQAADDFGRLDLTLKARAADTTLKLGAFEPDMPVLIRNDSRLLPQVFRGGHLDSEGIDGLTLHLGRFDKARQRNSSDYEGLLTRGGDQASDHFSFAGAEYELGDSLMLNYFVGELHDYYRQHFLGLRHELGLAAGSVRTDLRLFDSGSRGANARGEEGFGSTGVFRDGSDTGEVDNFTASARATYAIGAHELSLGFQQVNGDSDFPYVDNGDGASVYLITYAQLGKFQRSGERTWLADYRVDFADMGLPDLTFAVTYLRGTDIRALEGSERSEWERDLRLEYAPSKGALKNLNISVRHASLRSSVEDQRDIDEARLVLSYTVELD